MSSIIDKKYSLAIQDPIYGIDGSSHRKNEIRGVLAKSSSFHNGVWDFDTTSIEYFEEVERVSVDQITFGANYYENRFCNGWEKPPRREEFQMFLKQNPKGWIIWDKVNGTNDFSDCELIHTTFDFDSYVLPFMWCGFMQGKSISEGTIMQGNKRLNEKRRHPTQKPVKLYKYLIQKFHKQGEIFDPFGGSMSIAIAAMHLDVDIVSTEIDKIYFNQSKDYLINYVQSNLFLNAKVKLNFYS